MADMSLLAEEVRAVLDKAALPEDVLAMVEFYVARYVADNKETADA